MFPRILLVEDEEGLMMSLTDRLSSEGYAVAQATDGDRGLARALAEPFDVVVLDVRLPGRDGFEVCKGLRAAGCQVPILMLTARGQTEDRVQGLKSGADDYLVKPFETAELLARLEALQRRGRSGRYASRTGDGVVRIGAVAVDLLREEVTRGTERLPLLPMEFKLLRYFIQNEGLVLTRHKILKDVWGYDFLPTTRTIDVHVAGIRQKIEADPRNPAHLITLHRRGYKFIGERWAGLANGKGPAAVPAGP
ncbi:response regulator transcription factor [Mitsuaria sp. GD03876]|uniref:response regulator transcription factor n=1 Tax=Mitsuaria sp. GD03876 TaxID=2975399 RepID=UPI00244CFC79|nr:response regulator transcription factor [Mitsuaria sp. GD03876]MDH0865177.1 response regulator transcription factor [Mitsuaria sp. GD03876]